MADDTVRERASLAFKALHPETYSSAERFPDTVAEYARRSFVSGYLRSHRDTLDQVLDELRTLQGAFGALSESHAALDDAIARIEKLKPTKGTSDGE